MHAVPESQRCRMAKLPFPCYFAAAELHSCRVSNLSHLTSAFSVTASSQQCTIVPSCMGCRMYRTLGVDHRTGFSAQTR